MPSVIRDHRKHRIRSLKWPTRRWTRTVAWKAGSMRAGIAVYWIVNLRATSCEVYTQPNRGPSPA